MARTGSGNPLAVPQELRVRFHQQLDEVDREVVRLFDIVCERVAAATGSLVRDDVEGARGVTGADVQVDRLERRLEHLVERLLLTETPMCSDMRYLVTVLRIVPQLERCGDLAEHVAQRAVDGLGRRMTEASRDVLAAMGGRCVTMWCEVARAWAERDASAARRLDALDDELDELHTALTEAILQGGNEVADAIQATLVGRFLERLGDHAVHLAERIAYVAPGAA